MPTPLTLFIAYRQKGNGSDSCRVCETAPVAPFFVGTHIGSSWPDVVNLNTCHAGNPSCETTAALFVFKYQYHLNEMDIAKTEHNLSGARYESTHFIMEISLQLNWHNEVDETCQTFVPLVKNGFLKLRERGRRQRTTTGGQLCVCVCV